MTSTQKRDTSLSQNGNDIYIYIYISIYMSTVRILYAILVCLYYLSSSSSCDIPLCSTKDRFTPVYIRLGTVYLSSWSCGSCACKGMISPLGVELPSCSKS